MSKKRDEIFGELMEQIDEAYDLMSDYDAIPHNYGGDEYLYQSESQIIHVVGEHPGITARELSDLIRKTPSFCSQNIKKLRAKGYIEQTKNKYNAREYLLQLTEKGREMYAEHRDFEQRCLRRTLGNLSGFSDDELRRFIDIQKKINETFALDVGESRKELRPW
jgi:DNA-binding MarR family transcriptional regulator